MKKLILVALTVFVSFTFVNAQEIADNAIGLRIGDSNGFGAEISYQLALGSVNRLEADLGWRSSKDYNSFKLTGLYQWVWQIEDTFNWYAGAGGGLGSYKYDSSVSNDSGSYVFLAGDIGVEYSFDIPLLLSLDFRPEIGFSDFNDDLGFDIGIGIRYLF